MNVTFDEVEIVNGTYIPRYVKHESAPERELALLDLTREDGSVLISEKYGTKSIVVIGKLTADSRAELDDAIDSFKELFSRKAKVLSVADYAGGTPRTYVAYCVRHDFDRDHFHDLFVPWMAEFIVPSGVGKGATKQAYNGSWSGGADAHEGYGVAKIDFGSKSSKPYYIKITLISFTPNGEKGISFESQDKRLIYTQSDELDEGEYIVINCEDKKLTLNGITAEEGFFGPFPEFLLGNNTFKVEIAEILVEGKPAGTGTGRLVYGDNQEAQSFTIPWKDESVEVIGATITSSGTPANNVVLRIETDDGGKPSGDLVDADAYASVAYGDLPGVGEGYKYVLQGAITLEANTRYWLVVKTTGGDASNYYSLFPYSGSYAKGNRARTTDGGSNWTDYPDDDNSFGIFVGGKRAGTLNTKSVVIDYYPYYL